WRLRAAIWNHKWKLLLKWLKETPANLATQSRWRYWRARALEDGGHDKDARKLYEELAAENGYHSVLAAQRLGQEYVPHETPLADNPEMQARLTQLPALVRAREAGAIGEYAWVAPEFKAGTEGLTAAERLQAARLAARWGLYDQAVTLTA